MNAASRITKWPALLALLASGVMGCGGKRITEPPLPPVVSDSLGPFGSDSLGTYVRAGDGAIGVAWSAATGRILIGRVLGYKSPPDEPSGQPREDVGVFEVDPVSGATIRMVYRAMVANWFLSHGGRYVMLYDGSVAIDLATGSRKLQPHIDWLHHPVFSRGDTLLAFHGIPAPGYSPSAEDTTFVTRWFAGTPPAYAGMGRPQVFSPDSRRILVRRYSDSYNFRSYIVDIGTLDAQPVPAAPFEWTSRKAAIWDVEGPREYFWVAGELFEWQPVTGTTVLIHQAVREEFVPLSPGTPELRGTEPRRSQVLVSPDGTLLAFETWSVVGPYRGRYTLWLADRRTGSVRSFVESASRLGGAAFSPDGRVLAVSANGRLYLLNPATQNPHEIVVSPSGYSK